MPGGYCLLVLFLLGSDIFLQYNANTTTLECRMAVLSSQLSQLSSSVWGLDRKTARRDFWREGAPVREKKDLEEKDI